MTKEASIEAVERATKRSWDEWLTFMESIDAKNLDHHAIASILLDELEGEVDNIGWWAQATTVAYEQHIGRRIPGQRPDGTFQTSASKATKLGMQELIEKWQEFAAQDQAVQDLVGDEVRVSGTENRITWRAKAKDGSSIVVISEPKKDGTASIVAQQMGMETHELNIEAKAFWTSTLERFLDSL